MVTDHAHLIALNRFTGELLWDSVMDDWRKNYAASSAPLTAGNLVISGVTGGEHGANGFVIAFDQDTGKEAWRFWTVPKPGTPGSETWKGKDIEHGGAPTWFTGSYDPDARPRLLADRQPGQGVRRRPIARATTSTPRCILALDRKTGTLKWHYQFTPHDLWDWDATQTSVLVDADWQGRPRKLMLHANRNGFFYVFDRATGERLLSTPFVKHLTWASGIGADGRPIRLPEPGAVGRAAPRCARRRTAPPTGSRRRSARRPGSTTCRRSRSAASTRRAPQGAWEPGKPYLGGSQRVLQEDPTPQRILRAIDIRTGEIAWELPQPGPAISWGGTLATASGLVFVGRGRRRADGRRRDDRHAAVDVPDQRDVAGLADDLHVRRPPAHRASPPAPTSCRSRCQARELSCVSFSSCCWPLVQANTPAPDAPTATIANGTLTRVDLPARRQDRLLPRRALRLVGRRCRA